MPAASKAWIAGLPIFDAMLPPTSPATSPRVTAFSLAGDVDKLAAAWLSRAKGAGVRFLGEHHGYGWWSFSFEVGSRERGYLILTRSHGEGRVDGVLGRANNPPRSLPGACVPVPLTHRVVRVRSTGTDQRGKTNTGEVTHGVETTFVWDLDGDGQLDAFVPHSGPDNECPWQIESQVYVMRGPCGHDLGRVGPGYLSAPAAGAAMGPDPAPLTFTSSWSSLGPQRIPVHVTRGVTFTFDGTRYQKIADDKTEGLCHHCAASIQCQVMR